MKIFLIGYMGSGKSKIGQKLSEMLGFNFIDLDAYIQDKEGMSISEFFTKRGEIYFRRKERDYIMELLDQDDVVIALGGGTPCYGDIMDVLVSEPDSTTIHLKTSIPQLVSRLWTERAKRPLIAHLSTQEELTEFIGKHLFERNVFYLKSEQSVVTNDKTIEDIAIELQSLLE